MYSLNWKAEGESCLVIGAGHVALRKIRGLLEAGARVTVIAPEAEADIEKLSEEGKIRYLRKPYEAGDEEGCRLVVSTCGIRSVAEVLHQLMKGKGFLYNAADFPELGNCAVPARLKRGDLTIAVSTDGRSPALSRSVREWLDSVIPAGYGEWLDRVAVLREKARRELDTSRKREAFWQAAFSKEVMELVTEGSLDKAEEHIQHAMGRFRTES